MNSRFWAIRGAWPPAFTSIRKSSTCRKALKWLDARGVPYESIDIVEDVPAKSVLKKALKQSGLPLRAFFNTSGESYRKGGFKDKLGTMTEDQALSALEKDGKLIKRPFVVTDSAFLVGFDEAAWKRTFAKK